MCGVVSPNITLVQVLHLCISQRNPVQSICFYYTPCTTTAFFFASQSLSQFMRFSISCFFALSYSIPPQSPLPSTFILYIKFDLQNVIIHHKSITFEIFPPFLLSVINKCLQFGVRWIHRLYVRIQIRWCHAVALVCLCDNILVWCLNIYSTCPMSTLRINVRAFNK